MDKFIRKTQTKFTVSKFLRSQQQVKSTAKNRVCHKFQVSKLHPTEFQAAYELLLKQFYDEPFLSAFNIRRNNESNYILGTMWKRALHEDKSLKLGSPGKKAIKGLIVNIISDAEETYKELRQAAEQTKADALKKLLLAWAEIAITPKMPNDGRTLELQDLVVDRRYRRKGIAECLVEQSLYFAKRHGYRYVRVDCTNPVSAKICRKLKMELIWDKPFLQFSGICGPNLADTHVTVYIKNLGETTDQLPEE